MISAWILVFLGVAALAQAQPREIPLADAIAKCRSANETDRSAGTETLDAIAARGLTVAEGLQLIAASTEKSPATAPAAGGEHSAARFLGMLTADPKPEFLRPLLDAYDTFPADAKPVALAILIGLGPGDGLDAFVRKLDDQVQTDSNCDKALEKLSPENRTVLGALLEMLKYDGSTGSAVATLLKFAEQGKLPADALSENIQPIDAAYQRLLKKMAQVAERLQREKNPNYRWDDDYRSVQSAAEYFPDLLGYAGPKAERILRKTLELKDPRLSFFALKSLLLMDKDLPQDAINLVAGDDEVRQMLYEVLEKKGVTSRIPREFATQEALARSDMVRWLIYPTELDRAPNDIELMKVVSQDAGPADGIVDIYLFRFRTTGKHWAAKDGWMVGISGGYRRSEEPTVHDLGDTFSTFEKWDAKSPEQHVKDIQDLISGSWKRQAEEAKKKRKP